MLTAPSKMRVRNDRAALAFLIDAGVLSRAELEERIGLSKPAVSELLSRLAHAGLVEKAGKRDGGPGPRAQLWRVRAAAGFAAAADVRVDHVDIRIVDLAGTVRGEATVVVGDRRPADAVGDGLREACSRAGIDVDADLAELVLGMPGGIEPGTGHLVFAPRLPGWEGYDLTGALSDALHMDVAIENDVNLMALAELADHTADGPTDFVFVWVDEIGLGSAVVIDGRLHRGARGGAGEIDFIPVPDPDGAPDATTHLSETVRSEAIVALAARHGLPPADAGASVAAAAASTEPAAAAFLDRLAGRIALGTVSLTSVVDPAWVILGGSVMHAGGRALLERVRDRHAQLLTHERTHTLRWMLQDYREHAVLAGATRLALARSRDRVFAHGSLTSEEPAG